MNGVRVLRTGGIVLEPPLEKKMLCSPFRGIEKAGLEPATTRPPDVCATICATSRKIETSWVKMGVSRVDSNHYLLREAHYLMLPTLVLVRDNPTSVGLYSRASGIRTHDPMLPKHVR